MEKDRIIEILDEWNFWSRIPETGIPRDEYLERFQNLILTLFPKISLPGVVRVSLGIGNTEEEVDTLIHVLGKIAGKSRVAAGESSDTALNGTRRLSQTDIECDLNNFVKAASKRVYF